jgi:hypothetical protein
LRSRSFQNEIQCSVYFALSSSRRLTRAARLFGWRSATNACRSEGGQESPEIEVGAPRRRRVADERRFGDAVVVQIRCDEPIDRIGPLRPGDRRQIRTP